MINSLEPSALDFYSYHSLALWPSQVPHFIVIYILQMGELQPREHNMLHHIASKWVSQSLNNPGQAVLFLLCFLVRDDDC